MNEGAAESRVQETRVAEYDGVAIYIDYRLQPFYRDHALRLTAGGFGPLKNVRLQPDAAFAAFVEDLMQQVWDSPYRGS